MFVAEESLLSFPFTLFHLCSLRIENSTEDSAAIKGIEVDKGKVEEKMPHAIFHVFILLKQNGANLKS